MVEQSKEQTKEEYFNYMMSTYPVFGKMTDREYMEAEKKHGKLYTIAVLYEPSDTNEPCVLVGYLKRPERHIMGMAIAKMETNPVLAKEMLLLRGWVAGDERIKTDDDAFYSAFTELDEILTVRASMLKKNWNRSQNK